MSGPRAQLSPVRIGLIASISLSMLLVGSALFGADGVGKHEKLKEELDSVRTLNDNLESENRRLRVEAKALRSNPEYIEAVIRDELGWVKKNEIVFIFPSTEGKKQ
jgi:cell division protein FtsB